MTIGAGLLDTRCVFEKATKVSDGGGGYTTTWAEEFTVWGAFSFPRMRTRMEAIAAGAVQTVNSAELLVRDSSDTRQATKDWRVVVTTDHTTTPVTTQTWNVRKVYPRQRDGFLRFEVEAGVPT